MSKRKPGKVGENKSEIVRQVPRACADESAAVEFIEQLRWDGKPRCACCESENVYQMQNRETGEREANYRWRCRDCKKMYSVRKGTVLEDSRIPLRHWCFAFWAACSSKKGVSAKQIQRQTGLSYKSALFLMHRIRFAMADDLSPKPKLSGTVEVDETFIGGKPRHRIPYKPDWGPQGRPKHKPKQPVLAALCRDTGEVRPRVIPDVTKATLREAVNDLVDKSATLMTDDYGIYGPIGAEYRWHATVKHSAREYARGNVTTNTVEGFFSILKRGIYGTFHNVSRKHLPLYLDEFAFRYNTRKLDDGERTRLAVKGAVDKRLMYNEPTKRRA